LRVVQFNSSNWEQIINHTATAVTVGERSHIPLPPVSSSILTQSSILAAYSTTTVPKGRVWNTGGFLEQQYRSGLTITGIDASGDRHWFGLNQLTCIFVRKITADYSIRVSFPSYFKSVVCQVWAYTGLDDYQFETDVIAEFANLNFKIDNL